MIPGDPINAELNQIATAKNKPYPVHLTAYIHVMEADKTYQTLKVMSLDINRDYDNNIADELSIEVVYLPGSWSDLIYPYHENLEMTVVSSVGFTGNQAEVKRYKAYIKNPKNTGYRGIHDIYEYDVNSAAGRELKGLYIEIQYRTLVQHAWATAVEVVGFITESQPKFEKGDNRYHLAMAYAAEIIARAHENHNGPP